MNFIHAGQHDVNCGNFSPFVNLSTNSFASSTIVKSAVKETSNTLKNPMDFKAVTILPAASVPDSFAIPNASPIAALTAGAIATTTFLSLFPKALHTLVTSDFIVNAPVGHTLVH